MIKRKINRKVGYISVAMSALLLAGCSTSVKEPTATEVVDAHLTTKGDEITTEGEGEMITESEIPSEAEDFSKYVFGMSYQTIKDVIKQQKGREEQCRKQGCWWKRKEQLAKKQHHTGSTCR